MFLREQRQELAHVIPGIRIAARFLGEDPRVLEMAIADVIGGEREPGAIRLRHVRRNLLVNTV